MPEEIEFTLPETGKTFEVPEKLREQFPFKQHELVPGVTTSWPPSSNGYLLEKQVCEALLSFRKIGFGRMAQIAQLLQNQAEKESIERGRQAAEVRTVRFEEEPLPEGPIPE